jgi:large subunit ribosomal protein L9
MIKLIEGRRAEIEARKEQKRLDARGLKEKLSELELSITMPAGANGKLYGAVTNQTLADELAKNGFNVERKRIEIAGSSFKNAGKYKAIVKLYENQSAEISITVIGQEIKTEAPAPKSAPRRGRKERQEEKKETAQETSSTEKTAEVSVEPEQKD